MVARVHRRLAMCAVVLTVVVPATAQLNQQRGQGNQRRQAQKSYNAELVAIADQIAKQHNVKVVVDPAVFVPTPPKGPIDAQSADLAIQALVEPLKFTSWRRVYMLQSEAGNLPAPEKLSAAVRALAALETGGIVLEQPGNKRITSFQKNLPTGPNLVEDLTARQFSAAPVYVIFNSVGGSDGSGRSPQEQLLDLQKRQMDLMLQMDEEQLQQAVAQGLQMYMSLDPDTRGRFLTNMMQAGTQMFMNLDPQTRGQFIMGAMKSGMEMWQKMPEQQRQQMIQQMMQMGQQMFGGGGPGGGGRPPQR